MQQNEALTIMKMGYNVFLTGEAGTGKTFILQKYLSFLSKKRIMASVTASTGIAATHLNGVTLDSWSGLGIKNDITGEDLQMIANKYHLKNRIQKTKALIVDEISMISGTRFDAVDRILRYIRKNNLPFGGLQVILSGDLFQLPPVTNNRKEVDYIFKSKAWGDLDLKICYLTVPYRQKDNEYLQVLNNIRHNNVDANTRFLLTRTADKTFGGNFSPPKLYTHNIDVDAINIQELNKLPGDPHMYFMSSIGPEKLIDMMKRTCLAPEKLELKKNALVMFVRNNYEKGYVNGTIGKVIGFDKNSDPIIETLNRRKITATSACWTITEDEKITAQLTQHPLRLAWAITVHKSQGMTLDGAQIDLTKSFVEGMGYVALSRVKSLSGLKLLGFNEMALKVNPEVANADKYLIGLSDEITKNLKKLGFFRVWWKKWQFIYKMTS